MIAYAGPMESRPASPTGHPAAPGLADRLREATRSLHTQAERSGLIAELLAGHCSRSGYALLLRNLLPVYRAMEEGLDRHATSPCLAPLARPELYRCAAIESDLEGLVGGGWRELPVVPAATRYARAVADAADTADGSPGAEGPRGARLLAHAYVRYLGDLNGGRILAQRLRKSLALDDACLSFYAYPGLGDLAAYGARYREAIDEAGRLVPVDAVIDEGIAAFQHNIDVSLELSRVASAAGPEAD